MKFLKKTNIKSDLFKSLILIGLVLVTLFAITINRSIKINEVNKLFIDSVVTKNYIYKIERDINNYKNYENSRDIEIFKKDYYKLVHSINKLEKSFYNFPDKKTKANIGILKKAILELKLAFVDFVKNNKSLGSNEKSGLFHYLKISKRDFLLKSAEVHRINIDFDFLKLDVNIRNFLYFKETKYGNYFTKQHDALTKKIRNSKISKNDKVSLLFHINEYRSYFAKIVEIVSFIGTSPKNGIIGDMRFQIHNALQKIDLIIKKAESIKKRKIRRIEKYSTLSNLFLSTILLLLLFFYFRRIKFSIDEINRESKKAILGVDSLSNRLNLDGNEFKDTEISFNKLLSYTETVVKTQKELSDSVSEITNRLNYQIIKTKDKLSIAYQNLNQSHNILDNLENSSKDSFKYLENYFSRFNESQSKNIYNNNIIDSLEIDSKTAENDNIETSNQLLAVIDSAENLKSIVESLKDLKSFINMIVVNFSIESAKIGNLNDKFLEISKDINKTDKSLLEIITLLEKELNINLDLYSNIMRLSLENNNKLENIREKTSDLNKSFKDVNHNSDILLNERDKTFHSLNIGFEAIETLIKNSKEMISLSDESNKSAINSATIFLELEDAQEKIISELTRFNIE